MLHDTYMYIYVIRTRLYLRLTADLYILEHTHNIVRPMANTHNVLVSQFTVHLLPHHTIRSLDSVGLRYSHIV